MSLIGGIIQCIRVEFVYEIEFDRTSNEIEIEFV